MPNPLSLKNTMKMPARTALWTALALAAPAAHGATYQVTNLNASGAGSLRTAIAQANASVGVADVIGFDPGREADTIMLKSALQVTDSVDIQGPGVGITIQRDAAFGAFRLFTIDDGNGAHDRPVHLEKLTLRNGKVHVIRSTGTAIARGGAICSTEPLHLVSVRTGNVADGVDGNIVTSLVPIAALTWNGGTSDTHALQPLVGPDNPVDAGCNPLNLERDQRGYISREVGGAPTSAPSSTARWSHRT